MNDILFNIIVATIPVFGVIITGFIVPFIVSKLGVQKLTIIIKWIGYAVNAAESIYSASGQGKLKKEYVINFIDNLFNKKKIVITKEQIEVLIEATVTEINKTK